MARFFDYLLFFLIQFLIKKAEGFPSAFAMRTDEPRVSAFHAALGCLKRVDLLFGFTCNFGDAMPVLLKQAVRILVDNAAKSTPSGAAVTLRLRKTDEGLPCIDVQDNGIGMKQTDAIHVFDRFYRSDPARNSASGGSGLGLAIAKWIIDKHYGYFEVKSYEDIGTRISIVLPQTRFQKA